MRRNLLLVLGTLLVAAPSDGHMVDARGTQPLNWHSPQISRAVSLGYPQGATQKIEDRDCMSGPVLSIDVLDDYAYDIDEEVTVEIEFDLSASSSEVDLSYDRSIDSPGVQRVKLPAGPERWYKHTFTLGRARFSGGPIGTIHPLYHSDLSIGVASHVPGEPQRVTVCEIHLKRSYTTALPQAYGSLDLRILDENAALAPARIGIYDTDGRMPVPTSEAVPLKAPEYDLVRTTTLRQGSASWPVKNPQVFYVDGTYHTRLPVGTYEIIATRGLEYRILRQSVVIEANKQTSAALKLQRWTHLATLGWYSGDTHMHYGRNDAQDDVNIRLLMQAEDLNVANLLQAGNSGALYGTQYHWGAQGRYGSAPYTLVSGEEDPRTVHLGHTIELNLQEPTHAPPETYYLYHRVFDNVHRQGGLVGYAHAAGPRRFAPKGLALDVPSGFVDLIEVLQMGNLGVERWFDFLNLGYKLTPSAGSDAPYLDHHPGSVRNYVHVGKDYSVQGWFDNLKAGHTFVTNGPMLTFSVNGMPMGSQINAKAGDMLTLTAAATINPDIARLHKLEIIEQGKTVAQTLSEEGSETLELRHRLRATHGTWFVLKASTNHGREQPRPPSADIVALSAPIYVGLNDGGFCKPSAVPDIVADLKGQLQKIATVDVAKEFEMEPWDTQGPREKHWSQQQVVLKERIDVTEKIYDEILRRARRQQCGPDGGQWRLSASRASH